MLSNFFSSSLLTLDGVNSYSSFITLDTFDKTTLFSAKEKIIKNNYVVL